MELRRVGISLLVVSIALAAGIFLLSGTGSSAPQSSHAKAFAHTGGKNAPYKKVPLKKGDVITQGKRNGDSCIFEEPFGVGTDSEGGAPDLLIGWVIQEDCKVRVDKVEPSKDNGKAPPSGGQFVVPTESTISGGGQP
jgi:hypothetical protein